jgi:hypothetical protein
MESDEPKLPKFSALTEAAMFTTPFTDIAEPRRARARKDNVLPSERKSKTLTLPASRVTLRVDRLEPRLKKSTTLTVELSLP